LNGKYVIIWGKSGCGKTLFGKRLAYFFDSRGLFQDGVFFLNVGNFNKHKVTDNIKSKIANKVGMDRKVDFFSFFENKKILLIFDHM